MERHCIIFSVISLYAYNCFVDSDENSMGTNRVAYPAGTHSVKNEVTRVIVFPLDMMLVHAGLPPA